MEEGRVVAVDTGEALNHPIAGQQFDFQMGDWESGYWGALDAKLPLNYNKADHSAQRANPIA